MPGIDRLTWIEIRDVARILQPTFLGELLMNRPLASEEAQAQPGSISP
jgi:hypothetical protein